MDWRSCGGYISNRTRNGRIHDWLNGYNTGTGYHWIYDDGSPKPEWYDWTCAMSLYRYLILDLLPSYSGSDLDMVIILLMVSWGFLHLNGEIIYILMVGYWRNIYLDMDWLLMGNFDLISCWFLYWSWWVSWLVLALIDIAWLIDKHVHAISSTHPRRCSLMDCPVLLRRGRGNQRGILGMGNVRETNQGMNDDGYWCSCQP